jgi:hypothetical protein
MDLFTVNASGIVALVALGVAVFTLTLLIYVVIRHQRLLKRYRLLLNGPTGRDLDQILVAQASDIERIMAEVAAAKAHLSALEEATKKHLSRVGVVRFNPFPEMGSDLSFAIALLDQQDNGLVLSSLYSRTESRVYAKPIVAGKSTYTLTDEEKEALHLARNNSNT